MESYIRYMFYKTSKRWLKVSFRLRNVDSLIKTPNIILKKPQSTAASFTATTPTTPQTCRL